MKNNKRENLSFDHMEWHKKTVQNKKVNQMKDGFILF